MSAQKAVLAKETDKTVTRSPLLKERTKPRQLMLKEGKTGDEHKRIDEQKTSRPLDIKWKSSGTELGHDNNRQVELQLGFNTGPPQRIDGGNNSI